MRTVGLDRRKRLMLDEPHRLNQWDEVARARSAIAEENKKPSMLVEAIAWIVAYGSLAFVLSLITWLISKGIK